MRWLSMFISFVMSLLGIIWRTHLLYSMMLETTSVCLTVPSTMFVTTFHVGWVFICTNKKLFEIIVRYLSLILAKSRRTNLSQNSHAGGRVGCFPNRQIFISVLCQSLSTSIDLSVSQKWWIVTKLMAQYDRINSMQICTDHKNLGEGVGGFSQI